MNHRSKTKAGCISVSAFIAMSALMTVTPSADASAHPDGQKCFAVRGQYDENAVGPPSCVSPVNFCFEGVYSGSITGPFAGSVITLAPAADPAISSVLIFNSESEIQARVRGRNGTLIIRNVGSFETDGDGNIVDLQSIIGGTGDLAGASGTLRASGFFDPDTASGTSSYEGTVCLPKN